MSNSQREISMVVLGDTGVGKTSLMYRWVDNIGVNVKPTRAAVHYTKKIKNENNIYNISICDTAGGPANQDRYEHILPVYCRDAKIAVFVLDLSNSLGLENLTPFIEVAAKEFRNANKYSILIGNKSDCKIEIDQGAIDQYVKKYGIWFYFPVSAHSIDSLKEFDNKIIEIAKVIDPNQSLIKVFTHIQTLKKVCEENPNRKGGKNIKNIITMLELGSQQLNSQAYFEQNLNTLKGNLDALRWTCRSVLNTVVNVILAVFATLSIVGLPLLYCLKIWKPNEQNGVFGSFRFCTFGDKQKMQQLTEDVFAEKAVKGCQFRQW